MVVSITSPQGQAELIVGPGATGDRAIAQDFDMVDDVGGVGVIEKVHDDPAGDDFRCGDDHIRLAAWGAPSYRKCTTGCERAWGQDAPVESAGIADDVRSLRYY